MDISFASSQLEKQCNDRRLLDKKQGKIRAEKILNRLSDIRAAVVLEDLRNFGRLHELKGNRAGQLSFDLDHPYRLICIPEDDPIPKKPDGGLDWTKITKLRVLEIADTH
jgi:plasmid maintenance system killer protein